jgi:hypothetical protein
MKFIRKNVIYKLVKGEQVFTGELIARKYGLGPALSGVDKDGIRCHLPLDRVHEWKILEASNVSGT